MFKSQESIPFYLYHIFILAIVIFCWVSVALSYLNYPSYISVLEYLKGLTFSNFYTFFNDPVLAFTLLPFSFLILYCFNKKRYLSVHILLVILPCVIVLESNYYFVEEGSFIYTRVGLVISNYWVLSGFISN